MGLLDLLKIKDINEYIEEYEDTSGALLLDVRTPEEYREERIPNSVNIPLDCIESVARKIIDKKTPLFVHCRSGGRSSRAVAILKRMGYSNVYNIGGIMNYAGKKIRG